MGIGGFVYGKADTDEERFKVLDRLVELGCTNWDTSSVYGDSEELIGKWFKRTGKRDQIFLATKFGVFADGTIRGDPDWVRESVNTSLTKLQTDRIDLFYQHRTDAKIPIELTVRAMKEFVDQGKVRYLGLSEASIDTIKRAYKVHPISALQVEYSPWELSIEHDGILKTARELGITIVAYSPTGRGLATGRYRSFDDLPEGDFRRTLPKYQPKNFPRIAQLVDDFQELAHKYNATPAQLTLSWLLEQGDDIIPIPGSKQTKYVEENWNAINVKLSEDDVKRIRKLCDAIHGDLAEDGRYAPASLSVLLVDTPPLPE
jgi:aryl-alcohol dehydrogenase-like predicted oxidoreductase